MAVNLVAPSAQALDPVAGLDIGTTAAGVRKPGRQDLTVIRLNEGAHCAAVFTKNRFAAAPVQVCREHLAETGGEVRAILINTGNANAGTGARGLADARATCEALAPLLGCSAIEVLPLSTGVILEPLPVDRIVAGLPAAIDSLAPDRWLDAARAIMTTDTVPKAVSRAIVIDDAHVTVTGIAKGAGMIRPNMATMLSIVATDAQVPVELLNQWVREAADHSFNRITVDGDTSTNDTFLLVATGAGGLRVTSEADPAALALKAAVTDVARHLAQAIVRDGEGATKFITVRVEEARSNAEAAAIAYAIAHSPLVKTAFFASDPNLGRLLAAIGYAGVDDLDVDRIELLLDDVLVASGGGRHPAYREEDGQRVMKQSDITVTVRLARGDVSTTVWTCDFSHDYVSINADYRS